MVLKQFVISICLLAMTFVVIDRVIIEVDGSYTINSLENLLMPLAILLAISTVLVFIVVYH